MFKTVERSFKRRFSDLLFMQCAPPGILQNDVQVAWGIKLLLNAMQCTDPDPERNC